MLVYRSHPEGGIYKGGRTQRVWMRTVQVGDVLESPSGTHRVVRGVHRYANGDLRSLTFAIRHCSWTGRPVTSYGYTDLRRGGWRPTGVRLTLDTEMDAWMQAETLCRGRPQVSCCEAKDLP